jgi:hypothetical protein
VVRKKLALRLEAEKTDGERVYRIVAGKTSADTAQHSHQLKRRCEGSVPVASVPRGDE